MNETKRIQEYPGEGITVRFDPNICAHSAVCIRNLPGVFDLKGRPWVNVQGGTKEEIMALIDRCPSGALSYQLAEAEPGPVGVEVSPATEIVLALNGPLLVNGPVRIVGPTGELIKEMDKCALCRCGASSTKPFCDGTHRRNGFVG